MANCFYCERPFTDHGPRKKTFDHVIPVSRGGINHKGRNGVSCCKECNSHKGGKTLEQFIRFMKHPLQGYTEAEREAVIRNTQFLIENRFRVYNISLFRSVNAYIQYTETL